MNFLVVTLAAIVCIFILLAVLLLNSKTTHSFSRIENMLTIKHPLKQEVVDLDSDLQSWNLQRVQLWWGRIYSLNLELKSGKWQKVYARSLSGRVGQLVDYLEQIAPESKTDRFEDRIPKQL